MELRLSKTVTGTGDDGCRYTINGYKRRGKRVDGRFIDEAVISNYMTTDGMEVWLTSETPLEFCIPTTGVTIRDVTPV